VPTTGYLSGMSDVTGPYQEANEADLVEQQRTVGEDDPVPEPRVLPEDADEADVLDQEAIVTTDDEDDGFPS
jgi:hypothetical protein